MQQKDSNLPPPRLEPPLQSQSPPGVDPQFHTKRLGAGGETEWEGVPNLIKRLGSGLPHPCKPAADLTWSIALQVAILIRAGYLRSNLPFSKRFIVM